VARQSSSQNARVAARSRLLAAPPDRTPSADAWLPSNLMAPDAGSTAEPVPESADAVPAAPAAAAELGAEVQRLRRDLARAEKRASDEGERAQRAEREVGRLGARIEAMKRAAARAAAATHPDGGAEVTGGRLDLNTASFEQLRALGLSVTQAARLIGQREQHGGFASVDGVDAIVGIPKDVKQTLKQQGSVR
jgi:DNA uptake protein ComE-like DNA-binding protein